MPEPSPAPGAVAVRVAAPRLTIRLGPVRGTRRGAMAPEELRATGIHLNGGRRRGWKKHLALLLATPETTIAAWTSRSPGNARPIPGAVAVAVRLMADLLSQAVADGAGQRAAAQALAERVGLLNSGPAERWPQVEVAAAGEPVRPEVGPSLLPPADDSILVEPPRPLAPGG